MAIVRPSNKKLDSLLNDKKFLEEKIQECDSFIEHSKSPVSKLIRDKIELKLSYIEDALLNWDKLNGDQRTGYLAQRQLLIEISSFLSDSIEIKKQFERSLISKETEIEEYRKKLQSFNGNNQNEDY